MKSRLSRTLSLALLAVTLPVNAIPDRNIADTYADRLATDGNYTWALWRPYSCCQKRGQTFIGSTGE